MARVERSIVIHAPVERIFNYTAVPSNLPEFWTSLIEVKDVQPLPNGGSRYRWVYKMGGMRFEGTSEDVECVPNQRRVAKSTGGIESTVTWTFAPEAAGTKVTFLGDYTVPIPLLGRLAEALIVKLNEHETEALLGNLKASMESDRVLQANPG
ncbi:MAG TPA: SRPBCC family protein [Ktedonobacterales bacterium]|jgi:uncharacterized protein YndB with AHSA1/START domain|nr:SRPBCC family protein [Ktedonobacterales bacterium]